MNYKKSIALLTAIVLVGMTAGCSKLPKKEAPAKAEGNAVQVNVFQLKEDISEELKQACKLYESTHEDVVINVEVPSGEDYGAALRTRMNESQQPAIFNIGGPGDAIEWQKQLEDLSDQPWVPHAVEGTLANVTMDGKVYGLPYAIEGYGILYNKGIFQAAGVNLQTLTNYDGIRTAFELVDAKIKDGTLREKYSKLEAVAEYPAKELWLGGLHTANVAFANEFDSALSAFDAKTISFKQEKPFRQLVDLLTDFTPAGADKSKLNTVDYKAQVPDGIATQRVAAIQQGNWVYSDIAKVDESVALGLDMMSLPLKGVQEDSIPVGVPMYWSINRNVDEKTKTAAKDFLNWLYQSEDGMNIVVNEFKFIPPMTNFGDFTPSDPLSAAVKRYGDGDKTMPWVFMGFPKEWGQKIFGVELQRYLEGQATWEELVTAVKSGWESERK